MKTHQMFPVCLKKKKKYKLYVSYAFPICNSCVYFYKVVLNKYASVVLHRKNVVAD